eukprot:4842238-Amphidinium_carterae.1
MDDLINMSTSSFSRQQAFEELTTSHTDVAWIEGCKSDILHEQSVVSSQGLQGGAKGIWTALPRRLQFQQKLRFQVFKVLKFLLGVT